MLQLTRDYYQQNWQTLKEAIAAHYLRRNWYNTQKSRALAACYRQPGYSDEKPTEFLYRKVKLLNTIGQWTLIELIIEVMRSLPTELEHYPQHHKYDYIRTTSQQDGVS